MSVVGAEEEVEQEAADVLGNGAAKELLAALLPLGRGSN